MCLQQVTSYTKLVMNRLETKINRLKKLKNEHCVISYFIVESVKYVRKYQNNYF